jgi:hypothetical protein
MFQFHAPKAFSELLYAVESALDED